MVGGHLFRQNSHVVDGDPVRFGCIQNVVDLPSRLADRKCCQWCRACDCPFQDLFESLYGRRVRHSVQVAGHEDRQRTGVEEVLAEPCQFVRLLKAKPGVVVMQVCGDQSQGTRRVLYDG